MQIFIILYLIAKFGPLYSLPVIAELTDEQIGIAASSLRNDIRFAEPINKDISRNAIANDGIRWPNGVIYYAVDHELKEYKTLIVQTLDKMMKEIGVRGDNTYCIALIPRTDQQNYVTFYNGSDGCWSYIGRRFAGEQLISLAEIGCLYPGTIMHQTMHALGFYHEHQRSDRNNYVDIHLENVLPEEYSQFIINLEGRLLAPFDYDSIMIYGNKAFSFNGRDTIVAKNGQELYEPYYKSSLTYNDIRAIRALYGCETENSTQPTITKPTTLASLKHLN